MARGTKDPAFPLYARDWLTSRSVRRLSRSLRSVLVDLWCLQWLDGPLPDDVEWIAEEVRATRAEVAAVLESFFDRTASGYTSKRLEKERAEREELRRKRADAGQRGGRKGKQTGSKQGSNMDSKPEAKRKPAAAAATATASSDAYASAVPQQQQPVSTPPPSRGSCTVPDSVPERPDPLPEPPAELVDGSAWRGRR